MMIGSESLERRRMRAELIASLAQERVPGNTVGGGGGGGCGGGGGAEAAKEGAARTGI